MLKEKKKILFQLRKFLLYSNKLKKRIDSHSDLEEFESAQYYEDLRKFLSLKMRDTKRNDDKS